MTLEKAIEILELYMKPSDDIEPVDFDDAILLLIEAGERIKHERLIGDRFALKLLPGETKE